MTTDDSIRSMQRAIHALEDVIRNARGEMSAASQKRRLYERRLSEVSSIHSRLQGSVLHHSTDCGAAQDACKSRLDVATSGIGKEADLLDSLERATEKSVLMDYRGSEIEGCITREINRCKQEIDEAMAEYSRASATEQQASSSRSGYVRSARALATDPDATVQVWESTRY